MIYIVCLFHTILFIETFLLYQKKLRKRSVILGILNGILLIINLIKWIPSMQKYSSISFLEKELIANPVTNLLWILINILLIVVGIKIVKFADKKQKQNKFLKQTIYVLSYLIGTFFLILLFFKNASFLLFLSILGAYYFLIKDYQKEKRNYVLIAILIVTLSTWYSYFTYTGAARLQIALLGYPKSAYETGLEEMKYYEEKNSKKYSPIQSFSLEDGEVGIIEVKNYGFLKFGKVYKI